MRTKRTPVCRNFSSFVREDGTVIHRPCGRRNCEACGKWRSEQQAAEHMTAFRRLNHMLFWREIPAGGRAYASEIVKHQSKLGHGAEAFEQNDGTTMVVWDLKAMKPKKVLSVPGAPLEIRWSLKDGDTWAITASALTSKLWLVKPDASGEWQAKEVAVIGDPTQIPLPVDISINKDGTGLWVNTFMDGKTRYFDLSNPEQPKQTYERVTGKQVNMISQSWDGTRVYIASSLLANWDKGGADNEQFVRGFSWDGKELKPAFEVDFNKEKLGRAHHMKLGSKAMKAAYGLERTATLR